MPTVINIPLPFAQLFEAVKQLPVKEKKQILSFLQEDKNTLDIDIPKYQQKETLRRLKNMKDNPQTAISSQEAKQRFKKLTKQ